MVDPITRNGYKNKNANPLSHTQ